VAQIWIHRRIVLHFELPQHFHSFITIHLSSSHSSSISVCLEDLCIQSSDVSAGRKSLTKRAKHSAASQEISFGWKFINSCHQKFRTSDFGLTSIPSNSIIPEVRFKCFMVCKEMDVHLDSKLAESLVDRDGDRLVIKYRHFVQD